MKICRFTQAGVPCAVNPELVTNIGTHPDDKTMICFSGNELAYVVVDQPFDEVCASLEAASS